MKFRVTRTSGIFGDSQPCPEAVHDGCNTRGRSWWAVEFETLDELVEFVRTHGDTIVAAGEDGTPSLEIYDDYRE